MARLKRAQRKAQLIASATKVFARYGYDGTTTSAIAKTAGVTEPILYRHFKSKQAMFVAIVRQMSRQTLDQWRSVTQNVSDPAEQIAQIAREFPQHVRRLADAYHVIHGALACSRDRKVVGVMREHYEEIEDFFKQIIVKGQKARRFKEDLNPKAPAWQIIHMGIGYAMIALNLADFDHFPIADGIEFILRAIKSRG